MRRNRVKRILREFFRRTLSHLAASVDIVIVPKKTCDIQALSLASVAAELTSLMAKIDAGFAPGAERRP